MFRSRYEGIYAFFNVIFLAKGFSLFIYPILCIIIHLQLLLQRFTRHMNA